jgi:cyanate permease
VALNEHLMETTKLSKLRCAGIAVLFLYWTSFAWLPVVFRTLGVQAQRHSWLVHLLEIHYAPVLFLTPWMSPLFGNNFIVMWYAPVVVVVLGFILSSLAWWYLALAFVRIRRASG